MEASAFKTSNKLGKQTYSTQLIGLVWKKDYLAGDEKDRRVDF